MTTKNNNVPFHVAIIMDGNGRWANKIGKNRTYGHKIGATTVEKIIQHAYKLNIKYLTLYAFSTENWTRPKDEIDILMNLLTKKCIEKKDLFLDNNIHFNYIGDIEKLPTETKRNVKELKEITFSKKTKMQVVVALNYGGREEILNATKKISEDIVNNRINIKDINKKTFENYLYTKNIPDPDLLIRTSGEKRISNFLLWQCSYSELYFSEKKWPEFNETDFNKAIDDYNKRDRRFGKV